MDEIFFMYNFFLNKDLIICYDYCFFDFDSILFFMYDGIYVVVWFMGVWVVF